MEEENLGKKIVKSGLILSMYQLKILYMNFNPEENKDLMNFERIRALEKRVAKKYLLYKEDKIIRGQYKQVCSSAKIFYNDLGKDIPEFLKSIS